MAFPDTLKNAKGKMDKKKKGKKGAKDGKDMSGEDALGKFKDENPMTKKKRR